MWREGMCLGGWVALGGVGFELDLVQIVKY